MKRAHLGEIQGRYRGDVREIYGRCESQMKRAHLGEIKGRYRGDVVEMVGRYMGVPDEAGAPLIELHGAVAPSVLLPTVGRVPGSSGGWGWGWG